MNFLLVFFGGGLGSLVRYLIGLLFQRTGIILPLATFAANLTACFIFAVVIWYSSRHLVGAQNLKLLVLTGFCGGLSTFSTFGYESFLLIKQQMYLYACLNILLSVVLCIGLFFMIDHSRQI